MPAISNPASFRAEARFQRLCAVTGRGGAFHAHHAVDQQLLRRLGLPEWDTRNALRVGPDPHLRGQHSGAPRRQLIKTTQLVDSNVEYAVEVLGAARAVDYLRRNYDDSTPDPRLVALAGG